MKQSCDPTTATKTSSDAHYLFEQVDGLKVKQPAHYFYSVCQREMVDCCVLAPIKKTKTQSANTIYGKNHCYLPRIFKNTDS